MREIKFRAWDKVQKYMVYDNDEKWIPSRYFDGKKYKFYPVWISNRGIVFCRKLDTSIQDDFEFDQYAFENIELMQYTGLKDKNGKEIYDGDIVKYYQDTDDFTSGFCNFEVKWSDDRVTYMLGDNYTTLADAIEEQIITEIEVIGNIYENPELLEEAETV